MPKILLERFVSIYNLYAYILLKTLVLPLILSRRSSKDIIIEESLFS